MYYIVITPFFPTTDSFRGSFIYDQVVAIKRNSQHEVVVFKVGSVCDPISYTVGDVNVFNLPAISFPSYILNGFWNPINTRIFFSKLINLKINLCDIYAIHTHTANLASYAVAAKKREASILSIVQHHDLDPYNIRNGKFARHKWNAVFRAKNSISLFNQVDLHLCISKIVEQNLRAFPSARLEESYESYLNALSVVKKLPSPSIKKSYVLHNGVNTEKFYPPAQKRTSNIFTIGCIGNFVELKDHITLLRAVNMIKSEFSDIRLRLVGSGPTLQACQQYVKQNRLDYIVSFEKEVKHECLTRFYHEIDMFVLPSFFEGFGCVYTEAAACGVPFVCCKNQGAAECISASERDNWTIERGDYETLSKIIVNQYKNRDRIQMVISPYNIDTLISNYLRYIESLHG